MERGAEEICYPVFGEDEALGACIGLCDGGTADGTGDLACPSGWSCGVPALPLLYLPQPGPVACSEEDASACAPDYSACVDLGEGLVCARSARICTPGAP